MSLRSLRSSISRSTGRKRHRSGIQGLRAVDTHLEGAWRIEIDERELGTTVKRIVFSAVLHRRKPYQHEFLTGYRTKTAALRAARERIQEIAQDERPVWRPAGWRTRNQRK